ncbi:MAG TPA: signal peptidase I [Candidatus Saccharimonadales bacterium]|nr:signal peptidase I [Candidatus Saccharimonadales bacterium]
MSESELSNSHPILPGQTPLDDPGAATPIEVETGGPSRISNPVAKVPARKRIPLDFLSHLQFALLALTIALFIITFVVQAFRIPSGSMENTLLVGDYLLVDKTRYGPGGAWQSVLPYRAIHRGDIIVFRYPVDPTQHFVKRVIGMPGDRIRFSHSRVYINGRALHEPYVVFKEHFPDEFRDNFPRGNWVNENVSVDWATRLRSLVEDGELIVPRGQYFVLGDNRDQSLDSRYWGFVPRENIIGRPLVIYFSMVETQDEDDSMASNPADDKIFTLRARIFHVFDNLRWQRILRLAP